MHPQNPMLTKFTLLAKHFIYDAERFKQLLNMMGTPHGAVIAVHTVIGAIEQAKPVPPSLVHQLAFNCYALMVDMAEKVTGKKAGPGKMKLVTQAIMHATNAALAAPMQATTPAAPAPGGGIINGGM